MFLLLNDRKNMFMWSSIVFEIWGPKKYIFFIIGFQTSGSKTTKAPTLHGGLNFRCHLLVVYHYHCENMVNWSSLEFEIRVPTYRTLFNHYNGVLNIGPWNIKGPYPESWNFQSHLQVVNHCHYKNMVIWSSLVYETFDPKQYAL